MVRILISAAIWGVALIRGMCLRPDAYYRKYGIDEKEVQGRS